MRLRFASFSENSFYDVEKIQSLVVAAVAYREQHLALKQLRRGMKSSLPSPTWIAFHLLPLMDDRALLPQSPAIAENQKRNASANQVQTRMTQPNKPLTCPPRSPCLSRPSSLSMGTLTTTGNATCHHQSKRTLTYVEILLAYLKNAQHRGYRKAHIWACSPKGGEEYALRCHPSNQPNLTDKRLEKW